MQARKSILIAGAAVALLVAGTGWLIVGRWAYHRYLARKSAEVAPAGNPVPAAAENNPLALHLQVATSGKLSNGCIILAPFAEPETQRWLSLPKGLFETNGITFYCDGAIRLNGLTRARGKHSDAPGAIVNIPVNLKGNRLHWLHASENSGGTQPGSSYAAIVLHYEDGSRERVDLRYNVHGRDWFGSRRFADMPMRDPNSSVVWARQRRDGSHINFYHTIMSNPAPHLAIVSMDVISPLNPANVLLVSAAVSSRDQPLEPCPSPSGPNPFREVITFIIKENGTAAAGTPAPKPELTTLRWTAIGPDLYVEFPAFAADSNGRVSIDLPLQQLSEIKYQAAGPNGTIAEGSLLKDQNGLFPSEQSLILKKPVTSPATENRTDQ